MSTPIDIFHTDTTTGEEVIVEWNDLTGLVEITVVNDPRGNESRSLIVSPEMSRLIVTGIVAVIR